MRRRAFTLPTLLFGLGPLTACSGVPDASADGELHELTASSSADPGPSIVGGTSVKTCGWPTAAVIESGCSATLIHPEVVITAAHCGVSAGTTFQFGEREGSPRITRDAESCRSAGSESDWAYCVLEGPITTIPIVPPLYGCERDKFLKVGATAVSVGFGHTGPSMSGFGTKREVTVSINSIGDGEIDVGDVEHGNCSGDSGGPIFLHLEEDGKDYGWRVFGSTSGLGSGAPCAGTTIFIPTDLHVRAIEDNEAIDVTPCVDSDGNWAPGPACKDFPTDPANAGGSWPSCNPGPLTTAPIASCDDGAGGAAGGGAGSGGTGGGGTGATGGGSSGGSGGTGDAGGGGDGGDAGGGGSGGSGGSGGGDAGDGGESSGGDAGDGGKRAKFDADSIKPGACGCRVPGSTRERGLAWLVFLGLALRASKRRALRD